MSAKPLCTCGAKKAQTEADNPCGLPLAWVPYPGAKKTPRTVRACVQCDAVVLWPRFKRVR